MGVTPQKGKIFRFKIKPGLVIARFNFQTPASRRSDLGNLPAQVPEKIPQAVRSPLFDLTSCMSFAAFLRRRGAGLPLANVLASRQSQFKPTSPTLDVVRTGPNALAVKLSGKVFRSYGKPQKNRNV